MRLLDLVVNIMEMASMVSKDASGKRPVDGAAEPRAKQPKAVLQMTTRKAEESDERPAGKKG